MFFWNGNIWVVKFGFFMGSFSVGVIFWCEKLMWIIYECSWFVNYFVVKLFISFIDFLNICKIFVKKLGLGKNLLFFFIICKLFFFICGGDMWRYLNLIECCLNIYIEYLIFYIFYEDFLSDKCWIFLGISRLFIMVWYVYVFVLIMCFFEVWGLVWL